MKASLADPVFTEWLTAQRWFGGKGRSITRVSESSSAVLLAGDPELRLVVAHVDYDLGEPEDYQLLLGVTEQDVEQRLDYAVVARTDGQVVYDAVHDPSLSSALLRLLAAGTEEHGISFVRDAELDASLPGRVMTAEQSNTSVVFGEDLILKLFRRLQPGANPDIEVTKALADAGCTAVARPLAWMDGTVAGQVTTLGLLQPFLKNGADGWSMATASVRDLFAEQDLHAHEVGGDFAGEAERLGATTGEVHLLMAEVLPSGTAGPAESQATGTQLMDRLSAALLVVPELAPFEDALRWSYRVVLERAEPVPVQRVHGDFHLGQVMRTPEGWVLLDFEGEPARPLAERRALMSPLRDVAGMLRSFDYAARHLLAERPDEPHLAYRAAEWAERNREVFCDGYAQASGSDPRDEAELLRAFELDKAVYEVVYEARNRPSWLPIPLGSIERLVGSGMSPKVKADDLSVIIGDEVLDRIAGGSHHDPHSVLGMHPTGKGAVIRALRPGAERVVAVVGDQRVELTHRVFGIWEGTASVTGEYSLDVTYDGTTYPADDPYRFLPTLGEVDLHLIGEGRHERLWEVLGAHVQVHQGVTGIAFAVWAPNARGVRVTGDFNGWNGASHPMRSLGGSGVWELFIPHIGAGARYKFAILGADSVWRDKADPMAMQAEVPPLTASVVAWSDYEWGDDAWLESRARTAMHQAPMSVYEVHLGSWRQGLSYRELADQLVEYVSWLGYTHVELLPVAEHPFGGSWGYQVTSYYAPTSRFGTPDDFRYLVDRLHQAGVGVIVDWVPAHFPKDDFALARFDGTPLYEHADPRRGEQMDWGTYVFDFGRNEVRNFLVANAVYWLREFHIDGLRVDAVASMLYLDYSREDGQWEPNVFGGRENLEAVAFLQEMNAVVYREVPGAMTIAEESTSWPGVTRPTHLGGLGFGFKWNMGWMHDSLDYTAHEPIYRGYHHHQMTFSMVYAFSENYVLPISHDEVVHGKGSLLRKMPGDRWQQLANVRAYLGFMWAHPGKQLLFMGSEFAQESEWSEGRSLDWWLMDNPDHRGVALLVKQLNESYRATPALWSLDTDPAGFHWIDANDATGNVFSFLRFAPDGSALACVSNFAGMPHEDYRLGLPWGGQWTEVLNTDAEVYTGSGVGNLGGVMAGGDSVHGQPASAVIRVPPLATVWFTSPGPG